MSSNIIDNADQASIEWFMVKGTERTAIDRTGKTSVTITPTSKEEFEIECIVQAKSGTCYEEPNKTFTTQRIIPLPVEIIYFNAAKQGKNVQLEWATASEEHNAGFEVQVSQNGFDFSQLGFVATKNGNTSQKQVYQFVDAENGKYGTRYYRLKQVDTDGAFEYFTTKAVSFGEVSSYSLKAFPNPFESEVSLELNADQAGKLNVQVLDAMGKSVQAQQIEVSKGHSLEKIILGQSLPQGIYFVRTEMNGIANNFKLLKK
ncbi:T9SS type A sorting domain-containing protein [uncultured Pontibacter sp.]|uniref:T9SS type A sorting domain-containing protein n=1 Tax=uncultured Pontibacter sp. TaxID=453356 RepID=UPI00260C2ABD|nr:T9SS type A sorting domain-containing protein [uncultured Pontibacter sp.]